ncbi:SMI1/KNR4 family protein [bacterium]|nr:SMI1/KNR4 family protein [bacterium]
MSVKAIWTRIEAWFRLNAPDMVGEFQPPASNRHINLLEDTVGVRLPEEMEQSYKIHDGSWALRMFPGGNLLGIQGIIKEWRKWQEVSESGAFADWKAKPKGPIKQAHWNPRWLPLTTCGSGDGYYADLDPAPGGHFGQVIEFETGTGPVRVVATGFAEWLSLYASDLEAGRYVFEPPFEMVEAREPAEPGAAADGGA